MYRRRFLDIITYEGKKWKELADHDQRQKIFHVAYRLQDLEEAIVQDSNGTITIVATGKIRVEDFTNEKLANAIESRNINVTDLMS